MAERRYIHLLSFAEITEGATTPEFPEQHTEVVLLDQYGRSLHKDPTRPLRFKKTFPTYPKRKFDTLDTNRAAVTLINVLASFTEAQFREHKKNIPSLGRDGQYQGGDEWATAMIADGRGDMDVILPFP